MIKQPMEDWLSKHVRRTIARMSSVRMRLSEWYIHCQDVLPVFGLRSSRCRTHWRFHDVQEAALAARCSQGLSRLQHTAAEQIAALTGPPLSMLALVVEYMQNMHPGASCYRIGHSSTALLFQMRLSTTHAQSQGVDQSFSPYHSSILC